MAGKYFPAGFETHGRKDYFESDSDDELNDIVYPGSKPLIRVNVFNDTESNDQQQQQQSHSTTESSDDKRSICSTPEECLRATREYSVNRYDPSEPEEDDETVNRDNNDDDVKNGQNDERVKEMDNGKDFIFNWYTDVRPTSSNSLNADDCYNREARSPSPGTLLLEDIRIATLNGDLSYIKHQMSIDKGFFIDTVLKNGWTILMIASDFGHTPIVEFCLEHNADPNYHCDGFTPLMALCQSFFADEDKLIPIADLLLKSGASIDSHDNSRKTALMYACENGKAELAAFLAQHGADFTAKDNKQWTCLHHAARKGFGPVIRMLMDCGAKLNCYTGFGESPDDIALENGYNQLGVLLNRLKKGEEVTVKEEAILGQVQAEKVPFKTEEFKYISELEYFFKDNKLPHLYKFFVDQKIDFDTLIEFNECDIDALDISSYGEKLKLWEGIRRYHGRKWQPSRISYLKRKSQLNCNDALLMLINMSNHLVSMKSTFEYLHNHIKKDPELLKRGPKRIDVHVLNEQSSKTISDVELALSSAESLYKTLNKLSAITNDIPASQSNINTEVKTTESKPDSQSASTKLKSYQKVALTISGLLGVSALVYFQKYSITSILPKK